MFWFSFTSNKHHHNKQQAEEQVAGSDFNKHSEEKHNEIFVFSRL